MWSNWTPYPFNELPKTYSFLVKNPSIWRMGYYVNQPRIVHYPTSAFTSFFVHRKISEAFDHYQPDLVVSVHPLMQHVPLSILRRRIQCAPLASILVLSQLLCPYLHLGCLA